MEKINNIGIFDSLNSLWAQHPEGGRMGDWCEVDGVVYIWDIYAYAWKPESGSSEPEHTGRKATSIDGDLNVQNNLTVAGTLRAKHVKQPNCGFFATIELLQERYPSPEVGMWAVVGDSMPGAVWRCEQEGVWTDTGEIGGVDGTEVITNFRPTYYSEEQMLTFGSLGTLVGNTENGSAYLSAFSEQFQLEEGQTAVYEFTCFTLKQVNWQSWLACVGTTPLSSTSEKLVVLRNDNWEDIQDSDAGLSSNFDWSTFLEDMHDSFVVVRFRYKDGAITIHADITTDTGKTYFEEFTKTGVEGNLHVGLSIDRAHLYINTARVKDNE